MEIILDPNAPQQSGADTAHNKVDIIDTDMRNFAKDVLDASMSVPVVVDFWAPWCGPCKTLTPLIEKVTREAGGRVRLVKVNIDENQELAAQLRIQSVPTVYAFVGGRPVDGFTGALPESQIRQFFERIAGGPIESPIETLVEQADTALTGGAVAEAETLYGAVLAREPQHSGALAGMLRCRVAGGDLAGARQILERLSDDVRVKPAVAAAVAALEMAEQSASAGDEAALRAALATDPDNHQARFDLAMVHFAADRRDAAVEALIEIITRARDWQDDAARRQLLKFFDAWGPMDPASIAGRRRLSSVLFS